MGRKNEKITQTEVDQPINEQMMEEQSTGDPIDEEQSTEDPTDEEQSTEDPTDEEQSTKDQDDEGADKDTDEDEAKELVALVPVLYLSHQYKVGEKLPANNPVMVQAWLDAKSAAWMSARKELPKARPVAAESGLPGMASASECKDNLVGRVPITQYRKK